MPEEITSADLYRLITRLMQYPCATICRHAVAVELLALLEQKGHPLNVNLVRAVVDADDRTALNILENT